MTDLTEDSIRPAALMDGQRVAALTDIGRLLTRSSEFVDVPCPACDSDEAEHRFDKNGLQYQRCRRCDTMYVSPRPTAEVLDWFYRGSVNYAYWNKHIFPASEGARRASITVPRVDRLLQICGRLGVETGSLLEVGIGFGTFCVELNERAVFSRVAGVEPTPDLAQTCRDRGVEVIESPIEDVSAESAGLFDVVASFEVIEHLHDPGDFVRNMARLMKPGGLMFLTCPNGHGFDIEALGPVSTSVDHEHLNYFNPGSIGTLLESHGMQVVESSTPGRLDAELVRNKVLSDDYSLDEQPFLRRVLVDDWEQIGGAFQNFLVDNGLSSNLWVVARRPVETE